MKEYTIDCCYDCPCYTENHCGLRPQIKGFEVLDLSQVRHNNCPLNLGEVKLKAGKFPHPKKEKDDGICPYCHHPVNSTDCQRSHS